MKTIAITVQNEEQESFFKSLLANLRWDMQVDYLNEEDMYWPALEEELAEAKAEKAAGTLRRLSPTESVDDFWDKLMADDNV